MVSLLAASCSTFSLGDMTTESFEIHRARVLRNGADGGFAYASGRCDYQGEDVPVYVFMAEKADESRLESKVSTPFSVVSPRHDFIVGIGLSLWDCHFSS
jgi:hypothetical protein